MVDEHRVNDFQVSEESFPLSDVVISFEVPGDSPGKPSRVFRMDKVTANKLLQKLASLFRSGP
jgi:hypothetical protein